MGGAFDVFVDSSRSPTAPRPARCAQQYSGDGGWGHTMLAVLERNSHADNDRSRPARPLAAWRRERVHGRRADSCPSRDRHRRHAAPHHPGPQPAPRVVVIRCHTEVIAMFRYLTIATCFVLASTALHA